MTLFGGSGRALTTDFKLKRRIAALVAEDSLRDYDQMNDRMYSEVLEIRNVPPTVGSRGLQLVIKPEYMLEGFRSRRVMHLLPDPWEENLGPADNRLKQCPRSNRFAILL